MLQLASKSVLVIMQLAQAAFGDMYCSFPKGRNSKSSRHYIGCMSTAMVLASDICRKKVCPPLIILLHLWAAV